LLELLVTVGLLAVVSSVLIKKTLAGRCLAAAAGAFFHPQGIPGTLPEHVLFLCVPLTHGKRYPPIVDSGVSPVACWS
jgi:hypothetical protein